MLVRCIAVLIASALALPAYGQTYLPLRGGGGGGPFEARCSAGIMRGVELLTGDDVNGIRPICAGSDFGVGPWRGSSGGANHRLLCPSDRPAVTAITVAAEGKHTIIVNSVSVWCGQHGGGARADAAGPDVGWTGPSIRKNGWGRFTAVFGPETYRCPAGQAGIGLHGRHGIWLDSVGLICAVVAPPSGGRRLGRPGVPLGTSAGPPKTPIHVCQLARNAQARPNLPANTKAMLIARCLDGYPGGASNSRNSCVQAKVKRAAGQPYEAEVAQCFARLPRE